MIFLDTSALYAILDRSDANHEAAKACWHFLVDSDSPVFTTNYVLVESCALTQNRLGLEAVRALQEDVLPLVEVVWIDEATHSEAMTALLTARRRKLSLVDCLSFTTMRNRGSQVAFAFDSHFAEEGFAFPADDRGTRTI